MREIAIYKGRNSANRSLYYINYDTENFTENTSEMNESIRARPCVRMGNYGLYYIYTTILVLRVLKVIGQLSGGWSYMCGEGTISEIIGYHTF